MLVYFGYTFCPDLCPLSLANMARALDLLPPEQAEQVVPIFITVDPERDTVEQLADYAPLFHPRLVALTGSARGDRQAAGPIGCIQQGGDADANDYLVDHSTFIYLMGPDGRYRRHFGARRHARGDRGGDRGGDRRKAEAPCRRGAVGYKRPAHARP